jgi:hypothetical protein
MRLFRCIVFVGALGSLLHGAPPSGVNALWNQLTEKREKLTGLHQEFEVTQTFKLADSSTQSSIRQLIIDAADGKWREGSVAGSGDRITIFDGKDILHTEEGSTEFIRTKRKTKDPEALPAPYEISDPEWSKAFEKERRPCAIPGLDHSCVIVEIPLKRWVRNLAANRTANLVEGSTVLLLDTESG